MGDNGFVGKKIFLGGYEMEIFDAVRGVSLGAILLKTVISLVLGGALGYERGMKNRPAGFRTYMLVCLGSAMVMMTNQYIFRYYDGGDIVRMGAQVISGIGFLGAGTIMVTGRQQIRGITTAAGLWAAACCGLAIGIGFYEGAILGGITILVVMACMNRMEIHFRRKSPIIGVYLEYASSKNFSQFLAAIREHDLEVIDVQMNGNRTSREGDVCIIMNIESRTKRQHEEVLGIIKSIDGVDYVEEL